MKIIKQLAILFVIIGTNLFFHTTTSAKSINEIDLPTYEQTFTKLKDSFNNISSDTLSSIPELERPDNTSISEIQKIVDQLNISCKNITNVNDVGIFINDLYKHTDKLKKIPELSNPTGDLENSISSYLTKCANENTYLNKLDYMNGFFTTTIGAKEFKEIANDSMQCNDEIAITIYNSIETIKQNYTVVRSYTDSMTQTYNSSAQILSESSKNITSLSEENLNFGEEIEKLVQNGNFLATKLKSEQQELVLLQRNIDEDYKSLTSKQIFNINEINNELNNQDDAISFSLDDRNNWYLFSNKTELFQFLKLLGSSEAEVRLIKDKSIDIIQKRDSIVKINASNISNKIVTDLLSSKISNNSLAIEKYNQEQTTIKPKMNLLNEYVLGLKNTDNELREKIAEVTNVQDKCTTNLIAKVTSTTAELEKLPKDVYLEFDKQYSHQHSKENLSIFKSPDSTAQTNPRQLIQIFTEVDLMKDRFIRCTEGDSLKIEVASEQDETATTKGISEFLISIEGYENFAERFNNANYNYHRNKNTENLDVNYYVNNINKYYIEQDLSETVLPVNTKLQIFPGTVWTQDIITLNKTYKTYTCESSAWQETASADELELLYGECKFIPAEPITFIYTDSLKKLNEQLIMEMNKFINFNQIKLKGSCQ